MEVTIVLACFVAGLSTAAFVAIWFVTAYKELAHAKRCVENAAAQLRMHMENYPQSRDGPDEPAATQSLDTSRMIYHEVVKSYNTVWRKPMNRFPAFVLGIRKVEEEL